MNWTTEYNRVANGTNATNHTIYGYLPYEQEYLMHVPYDVHHYGPVFYNHSNFTFDSEAIQCIPGCIPPTDVWGQLDVACAEGDFIDAGTSCTVQCAQYLTPTPA